MNRTYKLFYLFLLILTIGIISQATAGRYYDPAYGRWTTFDPALNEKSPQELLELQNGKLFTQSPYNYSYNNPLRFIDPDGKVPILPILWAAAEAGFAAYDLYQLYQVYNDPNATDQERAEQYYATMSGLVAPGGAYKQIKEGVTSFFSKLIRGGTAKEIGERTLGRVLNSSKFDKLLASKGEGIQFLNSGSAKEAFEKLAKGYGIDPSDFKQPKEGVKIFSFENRTFTLRGDTEETFTISIKTQDNSQQIIIRFDQQ